MESVDLVRGLYESYQDRDWHRAAALLHPDAVVDMSATEERLEGREAVIDFQRHYPEPGGVLTVLRVLAGAEGAAAEVRILNPTGALFAMAAFWSSDEGLLRRGVEYWLEVGVGAPPPSRASFPITQAARRAWAGGSAPD